MKNKQKFNCGTCNKDIFLNDKELKITNNDNPLRIGFICESCKKKEKLTK